MDQLVVANEDVTRTKMIKRSMIVRKRRTKLWRREDISTRYRGRDKNAAMNSLARYRFRLQ